MSTDDFCLKWNDHHSVFFSSAERLCRTELLTDVTLSCGGREFSAHKLVLSVCSGYFAGLFARRQPMQRAGGHSVQVPVQTIVYLKDVEARHMELILDYMYRGEINVQEGDLMGLLATAKGLQVKGLTDAGEETPSRTKQFRPKPGTGGKPQKRPASTISAGDADSAAEIKRVKEESTMGTDAGGTNSMAVTTDDNGDEVENAGDANEPMPPRQQAFQEEEEGYVEEYGGEEGYDDEEEGYEQDDDQDIGGTMGCIKLNSKRRSYSVEYKKAIVEESRGQILTEFCKNKKLCLRMVQKWRTCYDDLTQKADEGKQKSRKCGSGRTPPFLELENIIKDWIADKRGQCQRAEIQAFALEMARTLDIPEEMFKASERWLDRFLNRHNLNMICL